MDLLDKHSKSFVLNMLKELRENMGKKSVIHYTSKMRVSTEREFIKRNQKEILKLKSMITEM